jgi:N6-adenosine-specific RNA methylase IME4
MARSLTIHGNPKSVLAKINTVKDAKDYSAQARLMRDFARQTGMGKAAVNKAAEAYLWAQYGGGRLLLAMREAGTRHSGRGNNKKLESQAGTPKLSELAITNNDASRWQRLASIPESTLEAYIADTIEAGGELTSADALALAREIITAKKKQRAKRGAATATAIETCDLILADPPWRYDFAETKTRDVENQYPTATVEEIESHCAADWFPSVATNAVLFLWATAPKLTEAMRVLVAWGFEYKTHAVWDKGKIGMGYWFRGQHELLLVGTRGTYAPPAQSKRVSSIFLENRGRHSAKPECVYAWIESCFPDSAKHELYQRHPRPGWNGSTNEI